VLKQKFNNEVKVEVFYKDLPTNPHVKDDFREMDNMNSKYDQYERMNFDNNINNEGY